jgi:uncharacterized cupredoxin-like copper-binding protein
MRYAKGFRLVAVVLIGLFAALLSACDGEDRPDVDVVDDGSSSASASGSSSASGASGSATGEPASAGVVEEKPADATQVDVTLQEWQVSTSSPTVAAGEVYFLVENTGPEDPHEFVIIRTDLAPGDLPTVDGKVPEDEVDLVDEIEPFTPGSSASITVNLEPGNYVLICNIAEIAEGELESHYELGMRTAFTVE